MASKSSHVRSISLPSRSHPTTHRIEEELSKIKTCERGCNLSRLPELYQCMDDLLSLPLTIEALSKLRNQKWGEEFLDGPVQIMDICGIMKDILSQFKENVRDLQSCLRRRKGDSTIESSMNNYSAFRNKMKKDVKRSIAVLKQINVSSSAILEINDQHISALIRIIREVHSTTIDAFHTVLLSLSAQSSRPKTSKWSLVSRLVQKGKVGCDDQQEAPSELDSVYSALHSLCRNSQDQNEKIQFVQNRLETLEATIEGMENGLEGVFRCLIRSRTSLLNIFSC